MSSQRICVISSGWQCWPEITDTVASLVAQTWPNLSVCITDDASGDQQLADYIERTCAANGWISRLRHQRVGAIRNQLDAIEQLNPGPEDIIVWVDPDGDVLKHPGALERVAYHYERTGADLIYFQYDTNPPSKTCSPSRAFPSEVIRANSYREFARPGRIWWNHLRTMRAKLIFEMDQSDFQDDDGVWMTAGTDSAFMFPGLELARGKVEFVDEVLLTYRSDGTLADWRRQPREVDRAHDIILGRPPKCTY